MGQGQKQGDLTGGYYNCPGKSGQMGRAMGDLVARRGKGHVLKVSLSKFASGQSGQEMPEVLEMNNWLR